MKTNRHHRAHLYDPFPHSEAGWASSTKTWQKHANKRVSISWKDPLVTTVPTAAIVYINLCTAKVLPCSRPALLLPQSSWHKTWQQQLFKDQNNEAMLCLHAAEEWEKQRERNQAKIDTNYHKIQEALKFLDNYRATCEIRELSYYDAFKFQTDVEDFNANVKRLELAGLWDEIVEMLRRYELPDGFESQKEWVDLGTRYRYLVEPLDIANYYRHSKNEDTGSYLVNGRPRRYMYTQRWLEHAQRMTAGSSLESCFWAMVEELCVDSCNDKPFEEARERILELENKALGWFTSGKLGKDVLLSNSTFVKCWKTLPKQHRSVSCIARFIDGEENLPDEVINFSVW